MNVRKRSLVNDSFIIGLMGYVLSVMCFNTCISASKPIFTTVLKNQPLVIYSMPTQQARANSNFSFKLSPLISSLNTEIDFQVTNHFLGAMSDLKLLNLTNGLTPIYDGQSVCSQVFTLNTAQGCLLRFSVDKSNYIHSSSKRSAQDGIIACIPPYGTYCWRLVDNVVLDSAVASAPGPTELLVTPEAQDGLYYDKATRRILGKPIRTGDYHFTIGATNGASTAVPQDLHIHVDDNLRDKPVFKHDYRPASAMPDRDYRLNLMELIEPTPRFMQTNQIQFRIDTSRPHPAWLDIDNENPTLLHGHVPVSEVGQNRTLTLIATSNTGGDSLVPLTIIVPVAFDVEKKPVIEKGIVLTGEAGTLFFQDLRPRILDPALDNRLTLVLDKVEPAAPWLSVSTDNPTGLTGTVPQDAVGQTYQLTVHANTTVGGNSDPVTMSLRIAIDKRLTPRFYLDNPQLPLFYAGQPYSYDFVAFNDVEPGYKDSPYTVEFADGHPIPEWIRIEENKLISDNVPNNLGTQHLFITVKNVPGGKSEVLTLNLVIMK